MKICLVSLCTSLHLFSSRWTSIEDTLAEAEAPSSHAHAPSARLKIMGDLLPMPSNSIFEIIMAWFLAFGADRIVAMIWEVTQQMQQQQQNPPSPSAKASNGKISPSLDSSLRSTFLFGVTHSVSIAARVYLGLIVAELILDRFPMTAIFYNLSSATTAAGSVSLRESAPSIAFTIWSGLTLCTIKRIIFLQSVPSRRLGRVALLDRFLDLVIFFVMILAVLDELSIDSTVLEFNPCCPRAESAL